MDYTTTFTDSRQSCTINVIPKSFDCWMRSPPLGIKYCNLFITESIRLKLSPSFDAAHIAEGEITGLADVPLGTVLRVGAGRNTEDATCGFTIRFVMCITGTPGLRGLVHQPLAGSI